MQRVRQLTANSKHVVCLNQLNLLRLPRLHLHLSEQTAHGVACKSSSYNTSTNDYCISTMSPTVPSACQPGYISSTGLAPCVPCNEGSTTEYGGSIVCTCIAGYVTLVEMVSLPASNVAMATSLQLVKARVPYVQDLLPAWLTSRCDCFLRGDMATKIRPLMVEDEDCQASLLRHMFRVVLLR